MTDLMSKALARIQKLPPEEQDAIAALVLAEIADDEAWDQSFEVTEDKLAEMAQRARAQSKSGKSSPGGFGSL